MFWKKFLKKKKVEDKVPVPGADVASGRYTAATKDTTKEKKSAAKKPRTKKRLMSYARFSTNDQVHFAKRLAFLVEAGVPVLESLHILRKQTKSSHKGYVYDIIIDDVAGGQFLSTSLGKFERLFGGFAVNLIKIGETGGILTQNLNYLADELKKKAELRRKVIGALIYPVFITVATILLSVMLTVFIFPKIMPIFESLNVKLPLTTLALLWLSNFLQAYGLYVLAAVIAFIVLWILALRYIQPFRMFVHHAMLRLPVVGKLTKGYYMTNFCRTLGLLLKSGVGVVDAVAITGDTMGNLVYKRECHAMSEKIRSGERISQYLEKRTQYFPDITGHLVAVGEASGNLSDTLIYLSEMYEADVSDMTKNLSNSIEPILMIFMGFIVGFIAVSVITPIYEVTQNLNPR